jgi:uncharacterized protein
VKAVIDTNVLVSGLIKAGTPPAGVISDVFAGVLVALYDSRILTEYRDVLSRPKFQIPPERIKRLLEFIIIDGIEVLDARTSGQLPDPDDQAFADVAVTGEADLLITGNTRHFPISGAVQVVTPREWLELRIRMREL